MSRGCFHPFFDRKVQVIRRLRAREELAVVVQLEEDLRIVLPDWMLDATCCQRMTLDDRPRIAVEALRRLRSFVDQQTSAGKEEAACGSMTAKGDRHEPPTQGQTSRHGTDSAPAET